MSAAVENGAISLVSRPEIEDVSQFRRILECDEFFSARSSVDLFEISDDNTRTWIITRPACSKLKWTLPDWERDLDDDALFARLPVCERFPTSSCFAYVGLMTYLERLRR